MAAKFDSTSQTRCRRTDPREQISKDALEQGDVRRQELGLVHIPDGPQHQQLLCHVAPLLLVGPRSAQHTDDRPHAIVIVRLAGELL